MEIDIRQLESELSLAEKQFHRAEAEVKSLENLLTKIKKEAKSLFGVSKVSELRDVIASMKEERKQVEAALEKQRKKLAAHLESVGSEE